MSRGCGINGPASYHAEHNALKYCSHKHILPNLITSLRTKKKSDGSIGYGTSIPCTMCTRRMIQYGVKKVRFMIENVYCFRG